MSQNNYGLHRKHVWECGTHVCCRSPQATASASTLRAPGAPARGRCLRTTRIRHTIWPSPPKPPHSNPKCLLQRIPKCLLQVQRKGEAHQPAMRVGSMHRHASIDRKGGCGRADLMASFCSRTETTEVHKTRTGPHARGNPRSTTRRLEGSGVLPSTNVASDGFFPAFLGSPERRSISTPRRRTLLLLPPPRVRRHKCVPNGEKRFAALSDYAHPTPNQMCAPRGHKAQGTVRPMPTEGAPSRTPATPRESRLAVHSWIPRAGRSPPGPSPSPNRHRPARTTPPPCDPPESP